MALESVEGVGECDSGGSVAEDDEVLDKYSPDETGDWDIERGMAERGMLVEEGELYGDEDDEDEGEDGEDDFIGYVSDSMRLKSSE